MVDREASEITLDLRREVCSVKSAPPEWPYVRRSRDIAAILNALEQLTGVRVLAVDAGSYFDRDELERDLAARHGLQVDVRSRAEADLPCHRDSDPDQQKEA